MENSFLPPEKPIDDELERAKIAVEREQHLLEAARLSLLVSRNPIGRLVAKASVKYHEKVAYDTDENLGMIEAMRGLRDPLSD